MTQYLPENIRVEDITAYLRLTGWAPTSKQHPHLIEFKGPHDLIIAVPRLNEYVDSSRRLVEAINLLAQVERRPVEIVAQAVLYQDRDVLRKRFLRTSASLQTLSLESASQVVRGLRNLVAYAACVEEDPKPYFSKATKLGRKFAEQSRFGHTFGGSFGFTIEMPVPTSPRLNGIPAVPPLERRVIERIVRGLTIIREGILSADVGILVQKFEAGFNANMYEVLLSLGTPLADLEYEFSVSWSPHWTAPEDLRNVGGVRLGQRAYQYFETAAKELRRAGESQEKTIHGLIIQLRSESAGGEDLDEDVEDFDCEERTITVLWVETSGRQLKVRVPLNTSEYRAACDAHRDGKRISVSGRIEKVGKFWQLMGSHGFSVES